MSKEILLVVDVVSNEKGVDRDVIFGAIEAALVVMVLVMLAAALIAWRWRPSGAPAAPNALRRTPSPPVAAIRCGAAAASP